MINFVDNGIYLANMHAACRTQCSEDALRSHLQMAVMRTYELARQRDELEKLCNYNERVMQELLQQRDELLAALEKLASLGNEPHYGNSIGNQIARDALAKVGAGETARPPTPTGWSDTDWIKHLQEQQHPLAGLHINQGSMDAAADAYEAEYNARHN